MDLKSSATPLNDQTFYKQFSRTLSLPSSNISFYYRYLFIVINFIFFFRFSLFFFSLSICLQLIGLLRTRSFDPRLSFRISPLLIFRSLRYVIWLIMKIRITSFALPNVYARLIMQNIDSNFPDVLWSRSLPNPFASHRQKRKFKD